MRPEESHERHREGEHIGEKKLIEADERLLALCPPPSDQPHDRGRALTQPRFVIISHNSRAYKLTCSLLLRRDRMLTLSRGATPVRKKGAPYMMF